MAGLAGPSSRAESSLDRVQIAGLGCGSQFADFCLHLVGGILVFAGFAPDLSLGARVALVGARTKACPRQFGDGLDGGACIGGGVDLVVCADMRYASADAYFSIKEIDIGMTADVGTLQRLPHLIPQGMVRELAYTGRRLLAGRALELGLVNAVYPSHEAMLAEVTAVAREIAQRSPLAILGTKEMLNYTRDHSVADSLNYVATWNAGMFFTSDVAEQMAANLEKRPAQFAELLPPRKLTD